MRKISLILTLLVALVSMAMAQRTISGAVVDDKGQPLLSATVIEKGTTNGSSTDLNGKYTLTVKEGATLVFSYVGYNTQEQAITVSNVLNVTMSEGEAINEVVVTALGIKRESRAAGYGSQQVGGDALTRSNAGNVVNALAGQVAGLNVTSSSGSAGASTYFTIRGQNSLTGNNQPLMVVDGIILNNDEDQTNAEDGTSGVAHSNRGIDLNPNDIESVNVLKGGAAAALYGIRAANGVILITTKKGGGKPNKAKGLTVNFSSTVTAERISQTPALQNTYAQGRNGGYRGPDVLEGNSFGPKISDLVWSGTPTTIKNDDNGSILYSDARGTLVPKASNPTGQSVTPVDNVNNFFQTGISYNNSLAISGGDERTAFRVSASNLSQSGVVPTNTFGRTTLGLSGSAKLSEQVTVSASATYVNSGGNRVQQGSNTSGIMLGLLRSTPTFDNSNGLKDFNDPASYSFIDGSQRAYRPTRYDNPYWVINKTKFRDNVNRLYGYIQADYKILPWLTLTGKTGTDTYNDRRKATFAINSSTVKGGRAIQDEYVYQHTDSYIYLNGNRKLSSDLTFNFLAGGNYYDQSKHNTYTQGNDFAFNGFDHLSNATVVSANETTDALRRAAFYGSVDFGYKNMLYLTLTGRNEWSSTLPAKNNSFFYPSASLGFVFADGNDGLIKGGNFLSFGKLRGSWAQVGNDADPYQTINNFDRWLVGDGYVTPVLQWPHNGLQGFGYNNTLKNGNLKPETTTSSEFGVDLRFLKGRVGVDVSYYIRNSKDLIVPADIAPTAGALKYVVNAGELESNGIDLVLNLVPVKTKNFAWNIGLNFNQNKTLVKSLAPGLNKLQFLQGFGAGTVHVPGQQFGMIYGTAFARTKEGKMIIDDNADSDTYGQPKLDETGAPIIGNPNPTFTMGINNGITYQSFSFNFLVDIRQGGQMWNGTRGALVNFGMAKETEARGTDVTFDGVKASTVNNDNTGGQANDIKTQWGQDVYQQNYSGFNVNEPYIEESGWVRLRTVQVGYSIPTKALEKTPFGNLSVSLIGRNLFLMTKYSGVDPETNLTGGNSTQGLEYFNMPGTRSLALSLNATF